MLEGFAFVILSPFDFGFFPNQKLLDWFKVYNASDSPEAIRTY